MIAAQSIICHGFIVQPKIVDGFLSDRGDFPFFVNVISKTQDGNTVATCGGSILNERYGIFSLIYFLFHFHFHLK